MDDGNVRQLLNIERRLIDPVVSGDRGDRQRHSSGPRWLPHAHGIFNGIAITDQAQLPRA
jgi:hypothetical protein